MPGKRPSGPPPSPMEIIARERGAPSQSGSTAGNVKMAGLHANTGAAFSLSPGISTMGKISGYGNAPEAELGGHKGETSEVNPKYLSAGRGFHPNASANATVPSLMSLSTQTRGGRGRGAQFYSKKPAPGSYRSRSRSPSDKRQAASNVEEDYDPMSHFVESRGKAPGSYCPRPRDSTMDESPSAPGTVRNEPAPKAADVPLKTSVGRGVINALIKSGSVRPGNLNQSRSIPLTPAEMLGIQQKPGNPENRDTSSSQPGDVSIGSMFAQQGQRQHQRDSMSHRMANSPGFQPSSSFASRSTDDPGRMMMPSQAPLSSVGDSFSGTDKNPISALMEYAQAHKIKASVEVLNQSGPSHKPW